MNFRLKTSRETAERLKTLQSHTGLTWNVLCRLAIALSLKEADMPPVVTNTFGVEIHRNTLTGEHDAVYKALIQQHALQTIREEDYFPDLFNQHIERGIRLLESEYQLLGSYDKLLISLLKTEAR